VLLLRSLKGVRPADDPNINTYVRSRSALRALGKALFWDEQLGSDGQACASCHFHAGVDNRSLNQINPGILNSTPGADPTAFSLELGFGANYQLKATDFPLHKLTNPDDRNSPVFSTTPNVVSSQGSFNAAFTGIAFPWDTGIPSLTGPGAIFNVGGVTLVRNVEPRQSPPSVNSTLNRRNFWDGRARGEFNGINPLGLLDPTAKVLRVAPRSKPQFVAVQIQNSSAASQASGPPLSHLEMSFAGRGFHHVGRRLLTTNLVPLGRQAVAPDDSLLGPYSKHPGRGLKTTYAALIKQAFDVRWWDAAGYVVDVSGAQPVVVQGVPGPTRFSMMEYNFPLFFGLAIQEYENLLVSDDSPFDRFMDGNDAALSTLQLQGLATFLGKAGCVFCHTGPALTLAGIGTVEDLFPMERMMVGSLTDPTIGVGVAVYDIGFYNIGVRPTLEDMSLGGTIGPLNLPLSDTRRFQSLVRARVAVLTGQGLSFDAAVRQANQEFGVPRLFANPQEAELLFRKAAGLLGSPVEVMTLLDQAQALVFQPDLPGVPGGVENPMAATALLLQAREMLTTLAGGTPVAGQVTELLALGTSLLPDPLDPGPNPLLPFGLPLQPDERAAVDGAFKTPSLRNVELSAPYFHNGGQLTLEQVVDFYDRGADFAVANRENVPPDILPLLLTPAEKVGLVAFLKGLTDDRVRYEEAPFDRPSLSIPNGGSGTITSLHGVPIMDDRIELPAVGAGGNLIGLGSSAVQGTVYENFLQQ
jgi:cytochrome c peroxidase